MLRTRLLFAAGAALRSSWCWPRSASYATPRCHAQMRLASPGVKFSWLAAKLSSAKSGQGRQMASCHARTSWPKPARRPRPPKVRDCVLARSPVKCLHARAACAKTPGAARVCEASPCRSGSSALVGKNTSGTVQPADSAQSPESNATSCAAMLRDCRAHGSARMGATSPGEPRLIAPSSLYILLSIGRLRPMYLYVRMCPSVQI